MRELSVLTPRIAGIRRFGSAALDLAYVAAGRYDGFWETGLSPWDVAAGFVIVKEAGGIVAQVDGASFKLKSPTILATNDHLFTTISKHLMDARKQS